MYGTCAYNMWLEKYGKEEADKRQEITKEKRKSTWEKKRQEKI